MASVGGSLRGPPSTVAASENRAREGLGVRRYEVLHALQVLWCVHVAKLGRFRHTAPTPLVNRHDVSAVQERTHRPFTSGQLLITRRQGSGAVAGAQLLGPPVDHRDHAGVAGPGGEQIQERRRDQGHVAGHHEGRSVVAHAPQRRPAGGYRCEGPVARHPLHHRGQSGMRGAYLDRRVGDGREPLRNELTAGLTAHPKGRLVASHPPARPAGEQQAGNARHGCQVRAATAPNASSEPGGHALALRSIGTAANLFGPRPRRSTEARAGLHCVQGGKRGEVVPADADPDLEAEQAYVDRAYGFLAGMRRRAEALVGDSEDPDLEAALARRVALLTDGGRALCFGRTDDRGGQTWRIGRRHVEDERGDPVVIEWRAPVALPFYRASLAEPMDLERRRQFVADRDRLLSIADDVFGPRTKADQGPVVRGRDALLAEMDRTRAGEMLDIVATIQAEQDEVIRAPLEGVLAVQGGPGTGKTAIGLHRAAYLLYAHPPLSRSGVLVIGPNRTFLRYIAQVLPSLGEEAVTQTTLVDLVPPVRVRGTESVDAQRVKGDGRMAEVLARALHKRRVPLESHLEMRTGRHRLVLEPDRAWEAVEVVAARRLPYQTGRNALRERLLRLVHEGHARRIGRLGAVEPSVVAAGVRGDPAFRAALDRLWPAVSPVALVRELICRPEALSAAAGGILDEGEQAALVRRPAATSGREPWTEADAALVDEARALLSGPPRSYGHVVVDEAQDLSPMQLRMLARRCPAGSLTVLGDLAQGTGSWAHDSWGEVVRQLPVPKGWRERELRLGYRTPAQVLDLASRLLRSAAPGLRPTESIRPGRSRPVVRRVEQDALAASSAAEAGKLCTGGRSVGVIVPASWRRRVSSALDAEGVDHGEAARDGLRYAVTVLGATEARGLEFDSVVLVEPAAVASESPRGLRLLYVAMTRPVHHLSVVHFEPLPDPLTAAT